VEIVKFGFRGLIETAEADFFYSSPLTGTFSYSCKYAIFTGVFVFAIIIRFREGSRSVIKASAVSIRPLKPLPRSDI
jgi:hypothetical protein